VRTAVVGLSAAAVGVLGIIVGGTIGAVYGHREALERGPSTPPASERPVHDCSSPEISRQVNCRAGTSEKVNPRSQ
jgi:hypothetical protein